MSYSFFFLCFYAVSRIALVKPEKARGVEDVILRAAQMGQIVEKVHVRPPIIFQYSRRNKKKSYTHEVTNVFVGYIVIDCIFVSLWLKFVTTVSWWGSV